MYNDKAKSILNDLLEINNDRIEGYKTAYDETEDFDLKRVFTNLRETSERCKIALENEIVRCGGKPTEGTRATGKIFRVWMDFKSSLTGKSQKAILNSCEQGEDVAVAVYEDVLNNRPSEHLSPDQISLIDEQYRIIKADHDHIRSMRNAAVAIDK